jgi:hypothetical protein
VAISLVLALAILFVGCASNNFEERPFFQQEYDLQTHGRKTLLDRLVEFDPGSIHVDVKPEYLQNPPARIAVLPFADEGSANFMLDKIPLTYRTREQRYKWAWTNAQRLRRAMQGYLAQREFLLANLYGVDAVVQDHGVQNMAELRRVSAKDLGDWLGVDALMYGKVVHYEAYYLALVAAWEVGIEVSLVSAHDGATLITAKGSRWSVSVNPALDPQDILINSAINVLHLRDINLARAEEEACREVVKRIPESDELVQAMAERSRVYAVRVTLPRQLDQPCSLGAPVEPGRPRQVILERPTAANAAD